MLQSIQCDAYVRTFKTRWKIIKKKVRVSCGCLGRMTLTAGKAATSRKLGSDLVYQAAMKYAQHQRV
jgi:hypothetical protein